VLIFFIHFYFSLVENERVRVKTTHSGTDNFKKAESRQAAKFLVTNYSKFEA